MTGEEMERAIEFLLENQAKTTSDIAVLKESVDKLVQEMAEERQERRLELAEYRRETREQLESYRLETREAINNLIIANEVTRDLANQAARLAIATSQGVTTLENERK
jgi:replication fork clamp-binding protein CrfC